MSTTQRQVMKIQVRSAATAMERLGRALAVTRRACLHHRRLVAGGQEAADVEGIHDPRRACIRVQQDHGGIGAGGSDAHDQAAPGFIGKAGLG